MIDNLTGTYHKLKADNLKQKNSENVLEDCPFTKTEFKEDYQETQIQILNQLEVKKYLWKEINESKKSLVTNSFTVELAERGHWSFSQQELISQIA